jgi:hypothetical protein
LQSRAPTHLLSHAAPDDQSRRDLAPYLRSLEQKIDVLEARIRQLEEKTQDIVRGVSDDGRVPYLAISARVGIMTTFWAKKPLFEDAVFSIGNAIDPLGVYVEMESPKGFAPPLDGRRSAIYVATLATDRPGEKTQNIGIEAHTANSSGGNIPFYGDYTFAENSPFKTEGLRLVEMADTRSQKILSLSVDWINLQDGQQRINQFGVQKKGGSANLLWR